MPSRKTTAKKPDAPRDWLRARENVADSAERWAKNYLATHKLPASAEILDALVEAYDAGAAEVQVALAKRSRAK